KDTFDQEKDKGNVANVKQLSSGQKFLSDVANASAVSMAVALALVGAEKAKDSLGGCRAISFGLIMGGAAALIAGDLWSNIRHSSRLKEVKDEWKDIVKPLEAAKGDKDKAKIGAIDAQGEAYLKLAKIEESMAKA